MKGVVLLLAVCVAVLATGCQDITRQVDMFGLINILYWKADGDRNGIITEQELNAIWEAFDQNGDKNITSSEFIPNWSAVTNMPTELSTAYFYLGDLDDDGIITMSDLRPVYLRFDLNDDGSVEAQEFNLKWQELYREAPIGVMFLRADTNKNDRLERNEFPRLFSSFGSNADGSVTRAEFLQQWSSQCLGMDDSEPDSLFQYLDTDSDGVVTTSEVGALFDHYDVSGNHSVELLELIQMEDQIQRSGPAK